jgi:hypothetical protein
MDHHIEKLIEHIYADTRITPLEIMKLRRAVEACAERVLHETGHHGTVAALTKSFDVLILLLQETLLHMRKEHLPEKSQEAIISLIESYSFLMQANLMAFKG